MEAKTIYLIHQGSVVPFYLNSHEYSSWVQDTDILSAIQKSPGSSMHFLKCKIFGLLERSTNSLIMHRDDQVCSRGFRVSSLRDGEFYEVLLTPPVDSMIAGTATHTHVKRSPSPEPSLFSMAFSERLNSLRQKAEALRDAADSAPLFCDSEEPRETALQRVRGANTHADTYSLSSTSLYAKPMPEVSLLSPPFVNTNRYLPSPAYEPVVQPGNPYLRLALGLPPPPPRPAGSSATDRQPAAAAGRPPPELNLTLASPNLMDSVRLRVQARFRDAPHVHDQSSSSSSNRIDKLTSEELPCCLAPAAAAAEPVPQSLRLGGAFRDADVGASSVLEQHDHQNGLDTTTREVPMLSRTAFTAGNSLAGAAVSAAALDRGLSSVELSPIPHAQNADAAPAAPAAANVFCLHPFTAFTFSDLGPPTSRLKKQTWTCLGCAKDMNSRYPWECSICSAAASHVRLCSKCFNTRRPWKAPV